MLKVMRESFHQLKWILLAVVAAFIIGFVFIDMGLGGASSNKETQRTYAARVNGSTISYRDYQRALYFTTENYKRMYGERFDEQMIQALGVPKQVLDTLVDQRLLLQEAERLHLTATQEEVRRKILQIPTLNPDGKFVGSELYTRFVQQIGFDNAADFEDDLARQITIDKMESALTDSVLVSPKAAEAEYRRISENAKIRYVMLPAASEFTTVQVTPAEVQSYYDANKSKYVHGEQRQIRYLIADFLKVRQNVHPTEQQLRERYEAHKAEYKTPPQAHALHILIKLDQNATPAQDAEAKTKAEALAAQIRGGADFATLAKANSADPGSAAKGGDLGWFAQGQMVPAFDQTSFSAPIGQITVVRSQFGYHIIKVLERKPESTRTFDEMRIQLTNDLTDETVKSQARDAIAKVMQTVRDAKPKTADEFAKLGNEIVASNKSPWFQKNEAIPGLGFNNTLSTWVFQAKPNEFAADPIGTSRGPAIPFVEAVRPSGTSSLDEVRETVTNDAKTAKALELAKQKLQIAMNGAPSVDAVATKLGLQAADTTVRRQGGVTGINGDTAALMDAAMASHPGEVKGPIAAGQGAIAFQVTEQSKVSETDVAQNRQAYMDQLRQQEARSLRQSLLQRLRKGAKVEVNEQLITAPTTSQEGA
ncbi:MAG TPA: SurA N-terminal domain-containing protein [Thermoanaerobaculia bacterium]